MTMIKRVQRLTKRYGTNNPKTILQAMGIDIIYCPLNGLRGIYKRIERNNIIFINDNLTQQDETFVLGHELGHYILHRGVNRMFMEQCTFFRTSRYENEANLFSVCLMAPEPTEIINTDDTIDTIAFKVGVTRNLANLYWQEVEKVFIK